MNLISDESDVAFFPFFKPLTTHISSLSCCQAINEEKTQTCQDTECSHTRHSGFPPMKFSCKRGVGVGGGLFHGWNSCAVTTQ